MSPDWDDDKSLRWLQERAFNFAFAALLFEGETVEFIDDRADYGETRIIALGHIGGSMDAVVYTVRDDVRWIISAFWVRGRELERWRRRAAAR